MHFSWGTAIYQLVAFGLFILFILFIGLIVFLLIRLLKSKSGSPNQSDMEKKLDRIIELLEKDRNHD